MSQKSSLPQAAKSISRVLMSAIAIIEGILAGDKGRPKKQQHTAKRIFERLRDEHGFTGGITIVKEYVAGWRQRAQEMFVPLEHPPGHAQADFGEAIGIIGGVERKIHFFAFDLPHSDACFVAKHGALSTKERARVDPVGPPHERAAALRSGSRMAGVHRRRSPTPLHRAQHHHSRAARQLPGSPENPTNTGFNS